MLITLLSMLLASLFTIEQNVGYNLDGIPLSFIFTNSELPPSKSENEMIKRLDLLRYEQSILKDKKVGCIEVSAKSADNLEKVEDWMDKCNLSHFDFDRKTLFDGYLRIIEEQKKLHLPYRPYDVLWGSYFV